MRSPEKIKLNKIELFPAQITAKESPFIQVNFP